LLLGGPDGVEPLSLEKYKWRSTWDVALAAHPDSGRLVVLGQDSLVFDVAAHDQDQTVLPGMSLDTARFLDAQTLLCSSSGKVTTLSKPPDGRREHLFDVPSSVRDLCVLPHTGNVVALSRSGRLHVFDGERVEEPPDQPLAGTGHPRRLAVSHDGTFLAIRHHSHISLYLMPLWEGATRFQGPMAESVPNDLRLIDEILANPFIDRDVRFALEPLRACLEHRFRLDVELGDAVRLTGGDDDIEV
jgi:hypothetical protein